MHMYVQSLRGHLGVTGYTCLHQTEEDELEEGSSVYSEEEEEEDERTPHMRMVCQPPSKGGLPF